MPGGDGTGPLGIGAHTGRGLVCCHVLNQYNVGLRLGGCRRFWGRGKSYADTTVSGTPRELLLAQKELLERRLYIISKQLEKN